MKELKNKLNMLDNWTKPEEEEEYGVQIIDIEKFSKTFGITETQAVKFWDDFFTSLEKEKLSKKIGDTNIRGGLVNKVYISSRTVDFVLNDTFSVPLDYRTGTLSQVPTFGLVRLTEETKPSREESLKNLVCNNLITLVHEPYVALREIDLREALGVTNNYKRFYTLTEKFVLPVLEKLNQEYGFQLSAKTNTSSMVVRIYNNYTDTFTEVGGEV